MDYRLIICGKGPESQRISRLIARYGLEDRIELRGFDFRHPCTKDGSDPAVKMRKLGWAERIIVPESPDIVRVPPL